MDQNGLRELVTRLRMSASALAALTLALDAVTSGEPLEPELALRVEEVLRALGAEDAVHAAGPAERLLLGEIRSFWHLDTKLVTGAGRRPGWNHTEAELLQATAKVTIPFAKALKNVIAPGLEGLVERLEGPDAAFLDVGCGVGMLSIEMARLWPGLRVVGIDVWARSLGLARDNVAEAGLADRIELREQAGETLGERETYDLVWIPSPFMSGKGARETARRAFEALRPGGWVLYALTRPSPDPLANAIAQLRVTTWGGEWITEPEAAAALAAIGYVDGRTLPGPPSSPAAVVAARRPVRS